MVAKGNLENLFELAIALEHASEVFYRGLAVKFSADLELEHFWIRFAAEEAGHARWLEDLLQKNEREQCPETLGAGAKKTIESRARPVACIAGENARIHHRPRRGLSDRDHHGIIGDQYHL